MKLFFMALAGMVMAFTSCGNKTAENAIKTSESGCVCKYATPESDQMKAEDYRTSISPAKKPMDVRP